MFSTGLKKEKADYLFLIFASLSCNKYDEIIANAYSALHVKKTIEFPENLKGSVKANYWFAIRQAHYNSSKSMVDDSHIPFSKNFYNDYHNNKKRFVQSLKLAAYYPFWNDQEVRDKSCA